MREHSHLLLATLALLSTPFAQGVLPHEPPLRLDFVLEGFVLAPDGAPAPGAVVITSAGGQAVTDSNGRFRMAVDVPIDAQALRVTSAGPTGSNQTASVQIDLPATGGPVPVDPLLLERGSSCQPSWVPSLGPLADVDDVVYALAVFDDGGGPALYAGGDFLQAVDVEANRIARWDGDSWSTVGAGVDGSIRAMVVFDDGGGPALYVAGTFAQAGGMPAGRIAKWDGSSWSNLGSGTDAPVLALTVFDDGGGEALYAAGEFTTAGGVTTNHIASWDGSSWSALGAGLDDEGRALTVYDDGGGEALYAGGLFRNAGATSANRVAKWDGTSWSRLRFGTSGVVNALAVYDDGGGPALFVGGDFQLASGVTAYDIAKWDGSDWSALDVGLGLPSDPFVNTLMAFDDGGGSLLYVGGNFTQVSGDPDNRFLATWNGTSWSNPGSVGCYPFALEAFDDGNGARLYAGGTGSVIFLQRPPFNVARRESDRWMRLGPGLADSVHQSVVYQDSLLVAGAFQSVDGLQADRLARWDAPDWVVDVDGTCGGSPSFLEVLDVGTGPTLYGSGCFTLAGGIARWTGTSWIGMNDGFTSPPKAMTCFDDGTGPALYAAGNFVEVSRWNGSSWVGLGEPDDPSFTNDLEVFDDGSGAALYCAGEFTTVAGIPANGVARWDGSSWSALGGGLDGEADVLEVFDDGAGPALYASGYFGQADGSPANNIAKWDGTSWSPLGSGLNSRVSALEVHDDGTGEALYAAGWFTTAGGVAANRIAKWDGAVWTPLGSGFDANVYTLISFDDGSGRSLFAGGVFSIATDSKDAFLAKWGCPDRVAPSLLLPAPIVIRDRLGSPPGEVVFFTVGATDDRDPTPQLVCDPPSGSLFPRGRTWVTCTASDASGNVTVGRFRVTVRANYDVDRADPTDR